MHDSLDAELLKAWCRDRCEASFRTLVQRHLGMVYAVAQRRMGNAAQAADVAQNVFLVLARKAGGLRTDMPLAPWLHRCAMLECADLIRRESRRIDAMKKYYERVQTEEQAGPDRWQEVVPHLDQAVDGLRGPDRDIIVMRYYQRLSYREIGEAMGKSAQAAQKQGERALERISSALRKKGAAVTAAVLAAGLASNVKAAGEPLLTGLVTQITRSAVSSTAASLTFTQTLIQTLMQLNTRTVVITAAVAAIPLAWKWRESSRLAEEVTALQQKVNGINSTSKLTGGAAGRSKGAASAKDGPGETASAPADARAWEKALLEGDPIERQRRLSDLLSRLTPQTAPAVFAVFGDLNKKGFPFDVEQMLFLRAWGRLDGAAAMATLKGTADMPPGDSFGCAALAGWAAKDTAGARAYLESLTDPQRKAELTYGLLDGWASTDFAAAAAYANNAPKSTERDRFRELLLSRAFSTGGVEGVKEFFAGIPADEHNQLYRQRAFESVTRLMMARDPAMARDWLTSQDSSLISSNVLSMAGHADPAGTMNWMSSLTNLDAKTATQTATDILSTWAQTDPTAATAWMDAQKNRPDRDSLVSSMAKSLGYTDAESAVKWAQSITDEEQRAQALASVARKTFRRNPDGAAAELANLGIGKTQIEEAQATAGQFGGATSAVHEFVETDAGGAVKRYSKTAPPAAVDMIMGGIGGSSSSGASIGSGSASIGAPAVRVSGGGGLTLSPSSSSGGTIQFLQAFDKDVE